MIPKKMQLDHTSKEQRVASTSGSQPDQQRAVQDLISDSRKTDAHLRDVSAASPSSTSELSPDDDDPSFQSNSHSPLAKQSPLRRFIARWNVKANGRYYTPGMPIPADALTDDMAEQLLSCEAIGILPKNSK